MAAEITSAEPETAAGESTDLAGTVPDPARGKRLLAALGLFVAAAGVAGWAGWSWMSAANDDLLDYAVARDEVAAAGKAEITQLLTMDYHDVDQGLARWMDNSTGPLRDQFATMRPNEKQALIGQRTVRTGKVLDAAINELDGHTGTARMLASVEITVAAEGRPPETQRNRFAAKLSRTGTGWKLSALDQVGVGTS